MRLENAEGHDPLGAARLCGGARKRADRQGLNEEGATARNSIGLPVVVEICGDCAENKRPAFGGP
jgi:hypothetical protein